MSLRLRLTILCTGLVALVLTGFAVSTFFIARQRIYSSFDDSLTTQADVIIALLARSSLTAELPDNVRAELGTQAAAGALFQIRDPSGNVVYSSFKGSPSLLPRGGSLANESFFKGKVAGQDLRLLYVPLNQDDQPAGYIEVGKPTEPTDEALTLIEGTLAAGVVLAVLLTIFPAYFIAGRALRPIREVSGLARRIEQTSDFSQRLQRDHSAEEIGELIVTFNDLIARVEHTLKSHNEFLADSSHELRRPLTNLRTNLDILRDPGLPAADRAACVDRMSREAYAMSTLVGDLLLLTRDKSQAFDHGLVDLSAVCLDTLSQCRMTFPGASISSDIEPGITVSGDRERLGQMLRNLIENAVEYSSPGSAVVVTLKADGSQAELTVDDTGYGIPSSEIPHVFDRFYRGERARLVRKEGVGLGLAIVRYVVEGHGGEIAVESSTEGGTTFSVGLPVAHAAVRHLSDVLGVS